MPLLSVHNAPLQSLVPMDLLAQSTGRRPKRRPYHGHGYLPDHPAMSTALVLSGAGIAPGGRLGHVRNIDVAPTIAELLGVPLRDVEGRVLREAIR